MHTPAASVTGAGGGRANEPTPPPPQQQHVEMRARIIKDILTLLQTPEAAVVGQGAAEAREELARRLESELWARAGGQIEDYTDLSTLKDRLQALPEFPRPAPLGGQQQQQQQPMEQDEAETDGEEQGGQQEGVVGGGGGNGMDWQGQLLQAWEMYPQGPPLDDEQEEGEQEAGDDDEAEGEQQQQQQQQEGEEEEGPQTLAEVLANIMLPPPATPWNPQSDAHPGVRLPPPLPAGFNHGYVHPVQAAAVAAVAAAQQPYPYPNPHVQPPPPPPVMQQQPPQPHQPPHQPNPYPILQYNPNIVMPPLQAPPRPSAEYLHFLQHTAAGRYQILHQQQQRLLYLRHASRCQLVDGQCPAGYPNCPQMKALWSHIARCSDQRCQYQHCTSSRYVLSHYHQCHDPACPVCGPVRATIRSRRIMDGSQRPPRPKPEEDGETEEARRAREEEEELQAYLDAHADNDLCCPIGLGLFENPVVFTDGMTYERAHILRHIQECIQRGQPVTSPKTNEVVIEPIMLPNVLIRSQVLEYKNRATAEWRGAAAAARRADHEEREREEEEARDRTADERRRIASPALRGAEEGEDKAVPAVVVAAEEEESA